MPCVDASVRLVGSCVHEPHVVFFVNLRAMNLRLNEEENPPLKESSPRSIFFNFDVEIRHLPTSKGIEDLLICLTFGHDFFRS